MSLRRVYLLFLFSIFSVSLFSYQWPTNKDFLESLFGTSIRGKIQDGIKFNNNNQAIYPLTDGEIIFYQDSFDFGDLDYKGEEGNILVLKHIGEFKSIYRNFSTTDSFDSVEQLKKTEMIGISSNITDMFLFSIYDDKKQAYINPQQILPFLTDDRVPVISSVILKMGDEEIPLTRNKRIPPGHGSLKINAWDVMQVRGLYRKFAPFSINVFVDGFERYNASYSSIKEIDGDLYLSGDSDIPLDDFLIDGDFLYGGEISLTNGRSLIEVVIKDIDGNEASKSYSVIVN